MYDIQDTVFNIQYSIYGIRCITPGLYHGTKRVALFIYGCAAHSRATQGRINSKRGLELIDLWGSFSKFTESFLKHKESN